MKSTQGWPMGTKDSPMLLMARHRSHSKKPTWIIVLVSLVSLFLIFSYVYPRNFAACYVFSYDGCEAWENWNPPALTKELTDDEVASRVVIKHILSRPPIISLNPKIAFLFLTPGALPFEKLWDKFFQVIQHLFTDHTPIKITIISINYLFSKEIEIVFSWT